jgi:chromosome partitioning protein
MPVVAVVNRKGGSGKSTFAAHVAAWCARQGLAVMLGDIDRQQSSRGWLRRRDPSLPGIAPWTIDQKNVLRVPTGITHVVLDTPGGLQGFELARIVMFADAIVVPVCPSLFDRESAAQCIAELHTLPRVAKGQCRVATVGMRVDGRTRAEEVLRAWADEQKAPMVGLLRETQLYVKSLERGLTVFDLPPEKVEVDLAQWKPVLDWLNPVLIPMAAPETRRESVLPVRRPSVLGAARPLNELAAGGGVLLRRPNPA